MIPLRFDEIFEVRKKVIIGVVHLLPLPGSPLYAEESIDAIIDRAIRDAKALEEGGVDGVIIENFGDYPFSKRVKNPLTISAFSVIAREVSKEISIPVGINFLRNSAIEAASVAYVSNAKFIRVNVFVETVATDSGIIEPAAPKLLRFIKNYKIRIGILADIHVKHGKVIGERSISETVKDAIERGLASAVIITGRRTGEAVSLASLKEAKSTGAYVLIGSGLNLSNIDLLKFAHGAIVGTFFKKDGKVTNPVDKERVKKLVNLARHF